MPRPRDAKPPAHLSPNPPVPEPQPAEPAERAVKGEDPTRFGDWTLKGIAIDF